MAEMGKACDASAASCGYDEPKAVAYPGWHKALSAMQLAHGLLFVLSAVLLMIALLVLEERLHELTGRPMGFRLAVASTILVATTSGLLCHFGQRIAYRSRWDLFASRSHATVEARFPSIWQTRFAQRSGCRDVRKSDPELAIRIRRSAFNRALADADLATIRSLLAPDVVLVAGGGAVLSGRQAQMNSWKREFATHSRTIYTRMPETIVPSRVEPMALEHGHWQRTAGGTPIANGTYTAKWRQAGADWVIEAELYLTLA